MTDPTKPIQSPLGGPNSKASIPLAGGTLLINPIDRLVPVILEGAYGMPGAGTITIEIPIPVDSAFLGFNVNLQAAFIDPTATESLALSNAVEAWIL